MEITTWLSIAAIGISILSILVGLTRKGTIIEEVSKYHSEKIAEVYKQHLALAQEFEIHKERHFDLKNRTEVESGKMSQNIMGMKESMDELKRTFKDFTHEIKDLLKEIRK